MYIPLYIVNDKSEYVVINDEWTSLQLQQFIADQFNIAIDDQIVYFQGKPLFGGVTGTLKQNGISTGDNIFVSKKLRGGSARGISIALTVMTIILLVLFCVTMIIGVVPVWAHVFGCYIKKGICWLFGTALNEGGFTGMILKYIMYTVTFFIVAIFVYSLTGVAFFMLLFNKKQHFCSSMVIARYIALTLTAIFIVIYALFALPDFAGQIGLKAQNNSPIFVGAILTPILNAVEWLSDKGKFALFYLIPIFGELILSEQDVLSHAVEFLYIFLSEMKEIGCRKEGFNIALIGMLEYFETPVGCTFVQDHNLKRIVELVFYTFEDLIRKTTHNGDWGLARIATMDAASALKGGIKGSQHAMAKKLHGKMQKLKKCTDNPQLKKQIEEFKQVEGCIAGQLHGISSMVMNGKKNLKGVSARKAKQSIISHLSGESQCTSGCMKKHGGSTWTKHENDENGNSGQSGGSRGRGKGQRGGADKKEKIKVPICKIYSTLRDYSKLKWKNYNYEMDMWNEGDAAANAKKKYEEENPMPLDPITKLALPFSENLICSIFQIFPAMNEILHCCIGRPYVMVNMIENSQIAGILTTIATLVIIILTYVLSSMYGYKM